MTRLPRLPGGRRLAYVLLAVLALALAGCGSEDEAEERPSAAAGTAADPRGFPRTYHIYSAWQGAETLGRYDMLVGFASNWDVEALRRENPNGIFLLQPGLNPGSADYGEVFVTDAGGALGFAGGEAERVGAVRALDPEWDLLHDPAGRAMGGWNLAAPEEHGTPPFVARLFTYAAIRGGVLDGWDGVHSDNWLATAIGADWFYGDELDTDRDGAADDLDEVRRRYADGLATVGRVVSGLLPGKIVGGNGSWFRAQEYAGSDPESWRSTTNYTLVEYFDRFYDDPEGALDVAARWLGFADPRGRTRYLAAIQRALTCDGDVLEIASSADPNDPALMLDPCVMQSMRWGLTLALMTGVYYEIYVHGRHGTRWWYDEFDGGEDVRTRNYLGRALGPPVELADGVYRREFENGVAVNNSSDEPAAVELGGTLRKLSGSQNPALNDGSEVTQVDVPAKDGIILLRPQARFSS
jgi:hypothetical protein